MDIMTVDRALAVAIECIDSKIASISSKKITPLRKMFLIALAKEGLSQEQWASMNNISAPCLSKWLSKKMTSKNITTRVMGFINRNIDDCLFIDDYQYLPFNTKLTMRQKMQISCIIAGTTIEIFSKNNGVSDMTVHHFLSGRKINGKKSRMIVEEIEEFITEQFAKLGISV